MLANLQKAFANERAKAATIYNFNAKVCKFSLKRISKKNWYEFHF
jgi:hypothetical protein